MYGRRGAVLLSAPAQQSGDQHMGAGTKLCASNTKVHVDINFVFKKTGIWKYFILGTFDTSQIHNLVKTHSLVSLSSDVHKYMARCFPSVCKSKGFLGESSGLLSAEHSVHNRRRRFSRSCPQIQTCAGYSLCFTMNAREKSPL